MVNPPRFHFVFHRKPWSPPSSYENIRPAPNLMPPRLGGTILDDPNHIWYWSRLPRARVRALSRMKGN